MIKLPEPVDQVRIFDHIADEYTTVQACDDYYTESQMRQAIRDAYEDAAKVCEGLASNAIDGHSFQQAYRYARDAIRKLKDDV